MSMKSSHPRLADPNLWARLIVPMAASAFVLMAVVAGGGQLKPAGTDLPNFDKRTAPVPAAARLAEREEARAQLAAQVPDLAVDFDPLLDSPKFIRARTGFLSGPNGQGKALSGAGAKALAANDPNLPIKAFLNEHARLFGHNADVLNNARTKRDYVDAHNGLRTVAWEQQLDGIDVFQAVMLAHVTRRGELTSISSGFVPDPAAAADVGTPGRAKLQQAPPISAAQALALAAKNIGVDIDPAKMGVPAGPAGDGNYLMFSIPKDSLVRLVWLPLNRSSLRLAYDVMVTKPTSFQRFQIVVDAQDGTIFLRHNLTMHISNATYTVFDQESPSPFSPSLPAPGNFQPPLTNRTTIVTSALDPIASPDGWIPDSGNTTTGNNVDAFVDRNADEQPDQPRPQGNPNRVFTFTQDLTQDPTNYIDASTVQLFWRANWYHDRLYQLGFTEAAGNFQDNNFGRGGLGNDHVIAFVQAGADVGMVDNSMFMPAPDGISGKCYMFIFTGPSPARDGSLDSQVVIHELTHGTSWRLVGGGMVLGSLQGDGMGEGWSDFYAAALLSKTTDDPDASYCSGGYVTYDIAGTGFDQNYYFGIRRYPYSTDMQKNPLTFKDIDPAQISPHTGVPLSPLNPFDPRMADEVHMQGEVWCMTLWELHANLVKKYGWTNGNQVALQLVTDGMKLTPALPNFLQARDAILLADEIDNAGANQIEIWQAFAKRGMGYSASSPDGSTTAGVVEAYDVPSLSGLAVERVLILGGNGNGIIDFDECNDLYLVLTNNGTAGATNILVTLSSTNKNVYLMRDSAPYPDIPAGGVATNLTPFKLGTSPNFVCGTPVSLFVKTKSQAGTDLNTLVLPSGTNGPPVSFDSFFSVRIPDGNLAGTNSYLPVTNIPGVVQKVTVSVYTVHPYVSDLTLRLFAPDGTSALLAKNRGGSGQNFGLSCFPLTSRTTFDDDATNSIAAGRAPFIGSFIPEEPLAIFAGKAGTNLNGLWRLQLVDGFPGYVGTNLCWSLNITASECLEGGGQCPGVDLGITMLDAPDPDVVGSNLVYTIIVTNYGPNIARGAVVTQNLPPGVRFVSAISSQGAASYAGGVVTATLGNLAIDGSATVTVTVVPTIATTIYSSASVASSDPELNPQNNSATAVTLIVPPLSDLAVGLSDFPDPTIVGGPLTYTVAVTNKGPASASLVMVSNNLPASVRVNSMAASQGTIVSAGNAVLFRPGLLPKDAFATATINVTPQAYGVINASAVASAVQPDPFLANNVAAIATTVGQAADLGISMTGLPAPVVLNSNITYQVTVTNSGPNTATNVVVSQSLPTGVNISTISLSQGTYTLSGNSLICSLGTIIVGGSANIRVVGATTRIGTLSSSAAVTSSQTDPNPDNNAANASTQVAPPFVSIVPAGATLISENFYPPDGSIEAGETVTIQFRLQNVGNVANTNLVATLLATGGVTSPSPAQTYGILRPVGVPGGAPVTRQFTFTAASGAGDYITATFQLQDSGSSLPPAIFSFGLPRAVTFANTNYIAVPQFGAVDQVGAANPYPSTIDVSGVTGQVGKVTVTLSNLSHGYAHDLNALLVSPTGTNVLLLSHAADISSATNVTLTFDATAESQLPEIGQLTTGAWRPTAYAPAVVFSNPAPAGPYSTLLGDLNGLNPNGKWLLYLLDDHTGDTGSIAGGWSISLTSVTPVNQLADVGIRATASPEPVLVDDLLTYTFIVSNAGPATATGVNFSNTLPPFLTFVSANVSQGNWTTNGNVLLANFATVPAGATAALTAVVRPQVGCPNLVTNIGDVSAFESDIHTGDNRSTVISTVRLPQTGLSTVMTATPDPVIVGSNLSYTISVNNGGPGKALNVTVSDTVPGAARFVAAAASQGSVTEAGGALTASLGTLVSGASATVSVTVAPLVEGPLTNSALLTTASQDNVANQSVFAVVQVKNPAPDIVPGQALILSENLPANGSIDPGETVTVSLALANQGVLDTVNLIANLLPSGGVTSPSGPVRYGVLSRGGPAVARDFSFTASPNIAGALIATLALSDGTKDLGMVNFSFNLPVLTSLVSSDAISIPDHGTALPYPSTLVVSNLAGTIGNVSVTLHGFTHSFPNDVNILLAAPAQADVLLMSHVGAGFNVADLTLTFDDSATASLPANAPLASGIYKPSRGAGSVNFPAPAPLAPYPATLAALNNTDPNGTWTLYVVDDSIGDSGAIASGWTLNLTTVQPLIVVPRLNASVFSGLLQLEVTGQSGVRYTVEASTDLNAWAPIFIGTAGADGKLQYTDPTSSTLNGRFYRVLRQGP